MRMATVGALVALAALIAGARIALRTIVIFLTMISILAQG